MPFQTPGVYVIEEPSAVKPIAGVSTSTVGFIGIIPDNLEIPKPNPIYDPTATSGDSAISYVKERFTGLQKAGEPKLCTNFGEFERKFGSFSDTLEQKYLAHAVYGFFNNGGTRCYVMRLASENENIAKALEKFESIDEIALVAAPGMTKQTVQNALIDHCERVQDRFAILDGVQTESYDKGSIAAARDSNYAAIYFPWIKVFDPATKLMNPADPAQGNIFLPPSGHIAGIYARSDTERGVHKAPANELIRGVLDVEHRLTKDDQGELNDKGINIIRAFGNNIKIWGARTLGGNANGEWKYVNVRRLFLYLRESIDEGTQWVVFEPNDSALWAKITRNITAFLTNIWRAGALFGNTPQEAFYVKCDAETNPFDLREQGQVITEIGVAVAKPAEFVIFRISQWAGAGK